MTVDTRVLQDLVYERVRHHVDLLSLVDFEHELGDSIERAMAAEGTADADGDRMSRGLLDEAWRRLEAEWRQVREAECPLCSGPYECPAPLS